MSLLSRLLPKRKPKYRAPILSEEEGNRLREQIKLPPLEKPKSRPGRVIKQTTHASFNPNPTIKGGRVIKVMPIQLQKIKQAQEKLGDDDKKPTVSDLPD